MPLGKFFYIKSKMNGMVLDIQASGTDPGTQVFMWDAKDEDDADNQLFYLDLVYGTIRTKLNDFCLEIDDSNTLVINPFEEGNDNQQWNISGDRIFNRADENRVLDVAQADEEARTRVCAWEYHGEENQQFEFEHASAKYFFIRSELNGLVLDIQKGDDSPGTKVVMWEEGDGHDNQLWYEDRFGIIRSKLNDFVLDASKGDSIRMQPLEPGNSGQLWSVIGDSILNHGDKNCLDIKKACEDKGTKLCSHSFHGGPNQLFKAEYV